VTRQRLALAVAVLAILALGVALWIGVPGLLDTESPGESPVDRPTGTAASTAPTTPTGASSPAAGAKSTTTQSPNGTTATTVTTTRSTPVSPFALAIDSVDQCGERCRDVTISLYNTRQRPASNVTAITTAYAGNGTDGQVVFNDTDAFGRLEANETVSKTKRVSLSLNDALAVRSADGWITIKTTVTSTRETATFTRRRNVE